MWETANAGTGLQLSRWQQGSYLPFTSKVKTAGWEITEQRSGDTLATAPTETPRSSSKPFTWDNMYFMHILCIHKHTSAEHAYILHCLKMKTIWCLCSPNRPDLFNLWGPFQYQDPGNWTHLISGDNRAPAPWPEDVLAAVCRSL